MKVLFMCTILRIIDAEHVMPEDIEILGIVLNVCLLLVKKKDAVTVKNLMDKETADLFKSRKSTSLLMVEADQEILKQTIAWREAQIRITPTPSQPRQRDFSFRGQDQTNYRGGNNRGNFNNQRGNYGNQGYNSNQNYNNNNNQNSNFNNRRNGGRQHQDVVQQLSPASSNNTGAGPQT